MNAQAQFLTITPEQLKEFERERKLLTASAERTMWTIGQLGTLFNSILDKARVDEEEDPFKDLAIGDLAQLGKLVCNHLFQNAQDLEESLRKLSPLETAKV
ncbi:MAG: hypothetical protein LKF82_07235 [Acinetobacter populi]|jgi:hypothetical protein|uniref:hypothetical protein n=1 Tax=Acinetobacter populi TaxID=1582270 RepID=UPI0023535A72|nr:hypothetical protein [Acinetobacter populi]MCH4247619.1 hypothetical protein [Acinetobacter populi]